MLAHNAPLAERIVYERENISVNELLDAAEAAQTLSDLIDDHGTVEEIREQCSAVTDLQNVLSAFGLDNHRDLAKSLRRLVTLKYRVTDYLSSLEDGNARCIERNLAQLRGFIEQIGE